MVHGPPDRPVNRPSWAWTQTISTTSNFRNASIFWQHQSRWIHASGKYGLLSYWPCLTALSLYWLHRPWLAVRATVFETSTRGCVWPKGPCSIRRRHRRRLKLRATRGSSSVGHEGAHAAGELKSTLLPASVGPLVVCGAAPFRVQLSSMCLSGAENSCSSRLGTGRSLLRRPRVGRWSAGGRFKRSRYLCAFKRRLLKNTFQPGGRLAHPPAAIVGSFVLYRPFTDPGNASISFLGAVTV